MFHTCFLVLFVLLSCLVFFHSAEEENTSHPPSCPPFHCGKPNNMIGFPFSHDANPRCGLFGVYDCHEKVQRINLGKGIEYCVDSISQDNTIHIVNRPPHNYESFENLTLPRSSYFSFTITHNITLFKCPRNTTVSPDFPQKVCKDFIVYYPHEGSEPSISPKCSMIQLPAANRERWEPNNIFSLLAGEFSLEVQVSGECYNCYRKGGQCHDDMQGGFKCLNASTEVQVSGDCYNCSRKGGQCQDDMQGGFKCQNATIGDKRRALKLGLGIGIGGASILVIVIVIFIILRCHYKRNKYASSEYLSRNTSSDPCSKSYQDRGNVYFGVPILSYCELEEATHNFDPNKELGDGGFGTVYHGILRDGREVAVKRLYENNRKRVGQFKNEIEILTRLRHKNLVTLYGCTSRHSRELLLVYEYIPNGTVADHLHGDRGKPCSFTWPIRLSIAIETASALAYLHASHIIHRDVKTNNILIDYNFCVKVADFGISRLFPTNVTHASTAPQGTPGYVDPQYHQCYKLTYKSDVYSFGVVLVELLSSLPAVDIRRRGREINLANLAISRIQKCAYDELIDSSLGFDSDTTIKRMTTSVAELAFQCLQNDQEMRPTMEEVLETLKGIESDRNNEMEVVEEEVDAIRPLPFKPEHDEIVLLNKMRPMPSPISVTEKWGNTSTTPNTRV